MIVPGQIVRNRYSQVSSRGDSCDKLTVQGIIKISGEAQIFPSKSTLWPSLDDSYRQARFEINNQKFQERTRYIEPENIDKGGSSSKRDRSPLRDRLLT